MLRVTMLLPLTALFFVSSVSFVASNNQQCTETVTVSATEIYVVIESTQNSESYRCGFLQLSRCTRYHVGYRQVQRTRVIYFNETRCCSGYENITLESGDFSCEPVCVDCDSNHLCTAPSTCVCPPGLTGPNCSDDIDECSEGSDSCHASATCINTEGSYTCRCHNLFNGDGFTCTSGPSHLDVRLVDGGPNHGRVEVYDATTGVWGTVCGNYWNNSDAQVVGRQLGLDSRSSNIHVYTSEPNHPYGEGPNEVFLQPHCSGSEQRLDECSYDTYPADCSHQYDAAVIYWPDQTYFDVKLTDGWEGRVDILYDVANNIWGTLCSDYATIYTAQVVCRQLGFFSGSNTTNIPTADVYYYTSSANYGQGSNSIFGRSCAGSENRLVDCAATITSGCTHASDVSVVCYHHLQSRGQIRLAGGTYPWEGRIEFLNDPLTRDWGTVCAQDWDWNEGYVVCRELGYHNTTGIQMFYDLEFGAGTGVIYYVPSATACVEDQQFRLFDCLSSSPNCTHTNTDMGISCAPYPCSSSSDCHENGTCNTTLGTLACICAEGYEGTGKWCRNINECYEGTHNCDPLANCVDTDGSYTCECRIGYTGTGWACSNVDECSLDLHNCGENFICEDEVGSYQCSCKNGLSGSDCSCEDGNILLVNGSTSQEGRVEVCYNNTYWTVCDDFWDELDAKVVCAKLGYPDTATSYSIAVHSAGFGQGSGYVLLDDLLCNGTEDSLLSCGSGAGINDSNCEHREDAGVRCQALCRETSVRLSVDNLQDLYSQPSIYPSYYFIKDGLHRGRVEVCGSDGGYKPLVVCDDSWTDDVAAVVCKELGFSAYGSIGLQTNTFSLMEEEYTDSTVHAVVSVSCVGDEAPFGQCGVVTTSIETDNRCSIDSVVEVVCQDYSTKEGNCSSGDMRLNDFVDDPFEHMRQGLLQICVNNAWGAVCSDIQFGITEMAVACKSMGFSDQDVALLMPYTVPYTTPIFLDYLFCDGSESTLLDCSPIPHGLHECSSRETVNLQCTDIDECENNNGGCHHNCMNTVGSFYCTCYYGHTLDADGMTCLDQDECTGLGNIRLVNGTSAREGRVEICYDGTYGTVCDDYWDELDATVICKQFGYALGAAVHKSHFGPSSRDVLLDNIHCSGVEGSILDCNSLNSHQSDAFQCDDSEVAGVLCGEICLEGEIRLNPMTSGDITDYYTNPEQYTEENYYISDELARGRVEVCVGGRYGTVCNDNWDYEDASVVCAQLGFSSHGSIALDTSVFGGTSVSTAGLDYECVGSERKLFQCPANTSTEECDPFQRAAVLCYAEETTLPDNCTHGSLRLMNSTHDTGVSSGRLEVCINRAWGTVCGGQFGFTDATVVCRQLEGFSAEGAEVVDDIEVGIGPIFLDRVSCSGSETTLLECVSQAAPVGIHSCDHSSDVGISCQDIDECSTGEHNCSQLCNNSVGSYLCSCTDGYVLDSNGHTCNDINECSEEPCDLNASCSNLNGSYECTCTEGYSGNGTVCEDVDECSTVLGICSQECNNTIGSYICFCEEGYILEPDGYNCTDIDECEDGPNNCSTVANCTNTLGSYSCQCYIGYTGDAINCTDIDECSEGSALCDMNAECNNTVSSYTCSCMDGYEGNGTVCEDIDECSEGSALCDMNAECNNTVSSYTCSCMVGYEGNGTVCEDIDECSEGSALCDMNAECNNTVSSYTCSCMVGYEGNGTVCEDIDECSEGSALCDMNAECNNTVSSYTCSCMDGYEGNGTVCEDIDECSEGSALCDMNAECNNTVSSYTCSCMDGYEGNGTVCEDIDECSEGSALCDMNAECNNTMSSYTCSCMVGYEGNGTVCEDIDECSEGSALCDMNAECNNTVSSYTCSCMDGYEGNGTVCEDIDECSEGSALCDMNAECNNTVSSYTCSCMDGYEGNGTVCEDIDECSEGSALCDMNAECNNTVSSYTCSCMDGYEGNGTVCEDIDECSEGSALCDMNAECNNTVSSYTCSCMVGYEGNGTVCEDIDECSEGSALCDMNAECNNTVSSYTCSCMVGYEGNGTVCEDIDECSEGSALCDMNAECNNTVSSYTCSCMDGYEGNGTVCEDVDECLTGQNDCDRNAECNNTDGSFSCSCLEGFDGNGTFCYCPDGRNLLLNGSDLTEGWVEVCYNNSYGTVCDDFWDKLDAQVVCHRLGFGNGTAVAFTSVTSSSRAPFLLDDVHCNGSEHNLLQCDHSPFYDHDCTSSEVAGVRCHGEICVDDSINLILGEDDLTFYHGEFNDAFYYDKDQIKRGRVEYCVNQSYHGVCADEWSYEHASIVCKQLGFSRHGAIPVTEGHFNSPSLPLLPTSTVFQCNGSEDNLSMCISESDATTSECIRAAAGVVCQVPSTEESNCTMGEIRLNGSSVLEGRVEICINNAWGTICSNRFSSSDSEVICRSLRYPFIDSYSIPLLETSQVNGPIFLDELECTGHEERLLDCHHVIGVHSCSHDQDIAVRCVDLNECSMDSGGCEHDCVNLVPGFECQCWEGYRLDENGINCTDVDECLEESPCHPNATCTNSNGSFACQCHIGFYGSGLNCTETCIDGLQGLVPSLSAISPNDGITSYYIDGRLRAGRVEVCHTHLRGAICDDDAWSYEDASVVCQQLGFSPYGVDVLYEERSAGNILLGNVMCNGSEDYLFQCEYDVIQNNTRIIGTDRCEDHAGVICQDNSTTYSNCTTGDIRLVPNTSNMTQLEEMVQGRLELCINNAWGTVCQDEFFDAFDAGVVCSQLGGYHSEDVEYSTASPGSGPIFRERLNCGEDDNTLIGCNSFSSGETSTCDHTQDVAIQCRDIDECTIYANICDHICNNTVGSFACYCKPNFVLGNDGRSCLDIDECESNTHNCDVNAKCNNTYGNYSCNCNEGYYGLGDMGTCHDIDECMSPDMNGCHDSATCYNTEGSYNCGCNEGYDGDGYNCSDRNECMMENDCHTHAYCINTEGSYNCSCQTGFTGNGTDCSDIDECESLTDDCHENANCNNTQGSYNCSCYSPGYTGNGTFCEDIDECDRGTDTCHSQYGLCHNSEGSYNCSCMTGFTGDGYQCENIDECTENTHECDSNGMCHDEIGSYNCTCNSGYSGNGFTCHDIDECQNYTLHDCHMFADCINTNGSYNCNCFESFYGDGFFCTCDNGNIRLINGTSTKEGRVEVCYDGTYETVCDDFWDELEATVVCNQLNFTSPDTNAIPVRGGAFGEGSGRVLLDDLLCEGDEENLLACQQVAVGSHACDHSEDAGVRCEAMCTENNIRLLIGEGTQFYSSATLLRQAELINDELSRGRVEICRSGKYRAVCGDDGEGWDNADAMVVCRELGFSPYGAIGLGSGLFPSQETRAGVSRVQCTGEEATLRECEMTSVDELYDCEHHAGVICRGLETRMGNCSDGDLQLIGSDGGVNPREGRVEVCFSRAWGSICPYFYDSEDANVICHQINETVGTLGPGGEPLIGSEYGQGDGPTFLNNLNCDSESQRLLECTPLFFSSPCTNQDIAVRCNDMDECSYGLNNCTDNADCIDKEGGFDCQCSEGFIGNGFINCSNIDECEIDQNSCTYSCSDTVGSYECSCAQGYVLAADGFSCDDMNECDMMNSTCGEDKICVNNNGSFSCECDTGYTLVEENCTNVDECQRGEDNCHTFASCNDTEGSYHCFCNEGFIGDGVNCTDIDECMEANGTLCHELATCINTPGNYTCKCVVGYEGDGVYSCRDHDECSNGTHNCSLYADCSNTIGSYYCTCHQGYVDHGNGTICLCEDWDIRLTNGAIESEGRVEVCFDNDYGAVCDDFWDELEAGVVCRHLGYEGTVHDATHRSYFGGVTRTIYLDNIICQGDESALSECSLIQDLNGITDCDYTEHAGVRCEQPCLEGEERLNNLYYPQTMEDYYQNPHQFQRFLIKDELSRGKVEVCVNGNWGTVCEGDSWNNTAASVACNQLGFSHLGALAGDAELTEDSHIVMYDVTCDGSEDALTSCAHRLNGPEIDDLSCDNAYVVCQDILTENGNCSTGEIQLIGSNGKRQNNQGRVEVCINNAWGTVCEYLFDNLDADVVCSQLGIAPGEHSYAKYGPGSGPIFLDGLDCVRGDESLLDCVMLPNILYSCSHENDIGVFCQTLCTEDTTYSPLYGNYTWPDGTSGGTTQEMQCYYANLQSTYSNCFDPGVKVQRFCNQLGSWEEPQYQQCPTLKRCQLLQVVDVSSETAAQVTETFQTILSNVSAEDQTEDNVALVADLLSNLASPGVQINEESFENAINIVGDIISWSEETLDSSSSRIIESVESMVSDLLNKESFNDITISGDTLTMVVEKVTATELKSSGKLYNADSTNASVPAPSVSLPPLLFQAAGDSESVGLAFAAYSTPTLFPVREMDPRFSIASPVLGVIINDMDTSSLETNVTITLPVQPGSVVPSCMYWSMEADAWRSDGCTVQYNNNIRIICSCNHLTNFGVLANTNPIDCDELTHKPSDDFTTCIERPPNVSVSVCTGLSPEELSSDSTGLSVTLLEGQTFGLVCETESHFTADWFTVSDGIIPVIGSDGGTIQYPSSEKAGQLYVYRRSPSIAVLLTRGLPKDGGVAVGIGEEAAGVYKCVARNVMETDIKTVSIDIMNDPSYLVYIRFTTNTTDEVATLFGSQNSDALVLAYYSTLIVTSANMISGGSNNSYYAAKCIQQLGLNDTASARIECEVSPLNEMHKNTLTLSRSTVNNDLKQTLIFLEDFVFSETGFCDLELDVYTIHGNYTWKETAAGKYYSSVCQFGPEDDVIEAMAMVTRMCAGPHNWLDYYGGYCITEVTWKIRQLANVTLATAEDVANVVGQLNTIFSGGTSAQDQSEGNLGVVLGVFSGAADLAENVSYTEDVVGDVTGVTSGISEWPVDVLFNTSSDLVNSFEVISENLVGQENFTNATVVTVNIAISGTKNDTDELQVTGTSFDYTVLILEKLKPTDDSSEVTNSTTQGNSTSLYSSASGSGDLLSEGSGLSLKPDAQGNGSTHNNGDGGLESSGETLGPYESEYDTENTSRLDVVSIYLPPAVFSNLTVSSVGLLYSYYSTAVLFPVRNINETEYPAIATPVIGASLAEMEPVVNLTDPIIMTLPYTVNMSLNFTMTCVSWNFSAADGKGNWSSSGCNLTDIDEDNGTATCSCNHLTNFAILVDIDTRQNTVKKDVRIAILTYVGLTLSIIGVIISLITLLGSKTLRGRDVTKFHVQLFIAILGMSVSFLVGIERTETEALCTLSSMVILYFTLASLFWMGAEALLMFKKLVVVFGSVSKKFVIAVSIVCWFLPVLFVIAAIATLGTQENYMMFVPDHKTDETFGYCFISDTRLLIGVLLVPMGLVMLFNVIMVVLAFRLVIQQNRKKFFQGGDKHLVKLTVKSIVSLMWLIVLFGVGWLFGIMTIREASKVFQYLFVISNAFQGFYFFIFICLNQKEARDFWAYILTLGRFKISKLSMPHNKMYANNSDYKVRGNHHGNIASLPVNTNLKKKPQLVDYLTVPNPFVINNDSVLDPGSFPLDTISELHEQEQVGANDIDSRIEVTTYFTAEEVECMGITVTDEGVSPDETASQELLQSDTNDNSTTVINFGIPQNGYLDSEFEGDEDDTSEVLYINHELFEECVSEVEEEIPVPPQRHKRKNENKRSATQKDISDLDEDLPRAPPRRKRKTIAISASEIGGENKDRSQDDKWPTRNGDKERRQNATITRQDRITSFADQSISRQREVIELTEVATANDIDDMGPLNGKEE